MYKLVVNYMVQSHMIKTFCGCAEFTFQKACTVYNSSNNNW